jgi:cryptochrome
MTVNVMLLISLYLYAGQVFEELLLDADWSVNAGMWMWLSCSSFFQQFFHCYCPVRFGRKADPNGDYIR